MKFITNYKGITRGWSGLRPLILSVTHMNTRTRHIRNCRSHERLWNDRCIDKNLKDDWLTELNKLKSFNLVSICEGISERRGELIYERPHVNLKIRPEYFYVVSKGFDERIINIETLQNIFSLINTELDFELKRSFKRGRDFNYREDIVLRIAFKKQRISERIDEETINWFEKIIPQIGSFDKFISVLK